MITIFGSFGPHFSNKLAISFKRHFMAIFSKQISILGQITNIYGEIILQNHKIDQYPYHSYVASQTLYLNESNKNLIVEKLCTKHCQNTIVAKLHNITKT
jgi:hypothetical protein